MCVVPTRLAAPIAGSRFSVVAKRARQKYWRPSTLDTPQPRTALVMESCVAICPLTIIVHAPQAYSLTITWRGTV